MRRVVSSARQLPSFVVEFALLFPDLLVDRQKPHDHTEELMIFAQLLAGLTAKLQADYRRKQQAAFFDQTADLVIDISTNGHKPGSRDEYRTDLLTVLALDLGFSIPARK